MKKSIEQFLDTMWISQLHTYLETFHSSRKNKWSRLYGGWQNISAIPPIAAETVDQVLMTFFLHDNLMIKVLMKIISEIFDYFVGKDISLNVTSFSFI